MYGGKNYFYYKKFSELLFLLIIPFMLFAIGVYMVVYTPYMFFIGSAFGLIAIIIGLSRYMSELAMKQFKNNHIKKALTKSRLANKCLFIPPCVKIFYAYLLILNEEYQQAVEVLAQFKDYNLSYQDQAKVDANYVLLEWKYNNNLKKAYEMIQKKARKGCDESIHYVLTRIYLELGMFRECRTYIENIISSYELHAGLRQHIIIAYFHTTQYNDAKIHFRTLYYDLKGSNKDTLYFMGKLKLLENKKNDANEFFEKALLLEKSPIDIVDDEMIKKEV